MNEETAIKQSSSIYSKKENMHRQTKQEKASKDEHMQQNKQKKKKIYKNN